jgi:hypothetical protein
MLVSSQLPIPAALDDLVALPEIEPLIHHVDNTENMSI